MISLLIGKIKTKTENSFVVLTSGGVGYEISVIPSFLNKKKINDGVEIFTYLKVSDSALVLYGFETKKELGFFELVMSVSGVGPKTGLHILSLGSIDEIKQAIARADVAYLTRVSGIGKKTAERMIVELKTKLEKSGFSEGFEVDGKKIGDIIDGLVSLGYSKIEAKEATKKLKDLNKNSEDLLREALKVLSI